MKCKIIVLIFVAIMLPSCKDFGCQITNSCPPPSPGGPNPCNCTLIGHVNGPMGTRFTYSCSRANGTKNYDVVDSAHVPAEERDAAAVEKCRKDP